MSQQRPMRRYQLKRRAERQADTRQRIVEAAMAAHETGDMSQVSISAIARRAGVSRLTIYRHFPDELTLVTACTSVYFDRHPVPDLKGLRAIEDPVERLRLGLTGLYAYYVDNERMLSGGAIALPLHPALGVALAPFVAAVSEIGEILATGWGVDGGPGSLLAGAIGHAVAFPTWRSLRVDQGLTNAQAVTLMASLVVGAAEAASRLAAERRSTE